MPVATESLSTQACWSLPASALVDGSMWAYSTLGVYMDLVRCRRHVFRFDGWGGAPDEGRP